MSDVRLNSQGMSRGNKALMSSIVADSGMSFVSADLASGEPTVTSHFSSDEKYIYCNFGGMGKAPYYKDGILMIDDMYLAGASVSPTGGSKMTEIFNSRFGGVSFSDQWLIEREVITKKDASVKALRAFHKTMILAMQYGQSPKGMVDKAQDDGQVLTLADAKRFHKSFWYNLFPDVRRLGERLKIMNKRQGYLVNEFGFRLFCPLRKSLNYFIQSSVSGVIDMLMIKFYHLAPYCEHLAIIHDELVFSCPDARLRDAKLAMESAVASLNKDLGWSVKIRTGWVEGKDFYTAH